MKTALIRTIVGMSLVLMGVQLIPVTMSNPPVEEEILASPEVKAILKRACYDCHSHETVWPGYSRVAPIPGCWPGMWQKVEKNSTSRHGIVTGKRNAIK